VSPLRGRTTALQSCSLERPLRPCSRLLVTCAPKVALTRASSAPCRDRGDTGRAHISQWELSIYLRADPTRVPYHFYHLQHCPSTLEHTATTNARRDLLTMTSCRHLFGSGGSPRYQSIGQAPPLIGHAALRQPAETSYREAPAPIRGLLR